MNRILLSCFILAISVYRYGHVSSYPSIDVPAIDVPKIDEIKSTLADEVCEILPGKGRAAGLSYEETRWPNATVPYQLDRKFSPKQRKNIMQAMSDISAVTCVKFVKRTHEDDYVFYNRGERGDHGCTSSLGNWGGKHDINLKGTCANHVQKATHETVHALGFNHEMTRPDRDDYINIIWDNIKEGHEHNFDKDERTETYGLPFDYHSIVMYGWNEFAKDKSKPTIEAKDKNVGRIEKGQKLSKLDIKMINTMYGCDHKMEENSIGDDDCNMEENHIGENNMGDDDCNMEENHIGENNIGDDDCNIEENHIEENNMGDDDCKMEENNMGDDDCKSEENSMGDDDRNIDENNIEENNMGDGDC